MEEKQIKYQNVIEHLQRINSKIETLEGELFKFKTSAKESIEVNHKILEEEKINEIATELKNISETIKNRLIINIQNERDSRIE